MDYYMGHSVKADVWEAVQEASSAFRGEHPGLILFFSDGLRFAAISAAMRVSFPAAAVVGCSTHASFSPEGFCLRGISLMAFAGLRTAVGCIHEITRHPMKYRGAVSEALHELDGCELRGDNTCCFLLNPSGTGSEELVLDTLAEGLMGADIPVFGGSASSEERVVGGVSLNGQIYTESSIFILMHTEKGRLHIVQDNMFQPTNRVFTVTNVDVEKRTIYELDGHPVADVLCRSLGVSFSGLERELKLNPLARIVEDNLFITEIASVNPDGSITTYCRTFNQSGIALLKLGDIRTAISGKLTELHEALPVLDFSIMVNCFSRTELFLQRGWMGNFTQLLGDSLGNYIGWSSHGEQRGVYHLNWTLLILSFGGTR